MNDPAFMTAQELRQRKLSDDAYYHRLDKKMREISEGMAEIIYDHADEFSNLLGPLVMEYDQDKAYELHKYLKSLVCGIAKREIPDFLESDIEPDVMCDEHPDRTAVKRIQTDSLGCETNDVCQECYDDIRESPTDCKEDTPVFLKKQAD